MDDLTEMLESVADFLDQECWLGYAELTRCAADELKRLDRAMTLLHMLHDLDWFPDWSECEHGFSPADSCPNTDCKDAEMRRLWDEIKNTKEG